MELRTEIRLRFEVGVALSAIVVSGELVSSSREGRNGEGYHRQNSEVNYRMM